MYEIKKSYNVENCVPGEIISVWDTEGEGALVCPLDLEWDAHMSYSVAEERVVLPEGEYDSLYLEDIDEERGFLVRFGGIENRELICGEVLYYINVPDITLFNWGECCSRCEWDNRPFVTLKRDGKTVSSYGSPSFVISDDVVDEYNIPEGGYAWFL